MHPHDQKGLASINLLCKDTIGDMNICPLQVENILHVELEGQPHLNYSKDKHMWFFVGKSTSTHFLPSFVLEKIENPKSNCMHVHSPIWWVLLSSFGHSLLSVLSRHHIKHIIYLRFTLKDTGKLAYYSALEIAHHLMRHY